MALLMRMGGIPARVVTGFSTGATDTKTGEYVVRDFDAHSWVEVYYPGWGWITFDPTPAASPARSQPADAASSGSSHRLAGSPVRRPALRARRGRPRRGAVEAVVVLADPRPGGPGRRGAAGPRLAALAPRRPAGADRARARAPPHPPRPGARHDAARARAALLLDAGRRRLRARAAREPLRATNRATRPAPSAAACGPSSDAAPACSVICVPGGRCRRDNVALRAYN